MIILHIHQKHKKRHLIASWICMDYFLSECLEGIAVLSLHSTLDIQTGYPLISLIIFPLLYTSMGLPNILLFRSDEVHDLISFFDYNGVSSLWQLNGVSRESAHRSVAITGPHYAPIRYSSKAKADVL